MSKKTEIQRGCEICGAPSKNKGVVNGKRRYSRYCSSHDRAIYRKVHTHILHKGDICELCGFVPINKVQLDVDHIDGNHENNDPSNLQTLCANCHRLKTYMNKDWQSRVDDGDITAEQYNLF